MRRMRKLEVRTGTGLLELYGRDSPGRDSLSPFANPAPANVESAGDGMVRPELGAGSGNQEGNTSGRGPAPLMGASPTGASVYAVERRGRQRTNMGLGSEVIRKRGAAASLVAVW